jgi:hypothetical protein
MRRCEPVPLAALLSGLLAGAAAAQGMAADSSFPPAEPIVSTAVGANTLGPNPPASSARSVAATTIESFAGNPLWAIPLSDLSQTNTRPLFSPSRLPPAPPVYALASAAAKPVPPRKRGPDHPLLTLLGTIVGQSVEIGVFNDEASHDVIRLKAGDVHDGWTLRTVVDRAALFEKEGYRPTTLALPAASAEASTATGGNGRIRVAPPVSTSVPANTEGGSRRPPKEG